jgi:glycosyltransferase involved in cell wall biosynthesis
MQRDILPQVIFSPAMLAISLVEQLARAGAEVTLFTPGPVNTTVTNSVADMGYFERELAGRGDSYIDLLKKHPFTFITLARQVQSEIIADVYRRANADEFDIVHIYTNEEEIALTFADLCRKPVVFTHHDPFNFTVKYKNNLPKYKHRAWISLSFAQRASMPADTNWLANIYHGLSESKLLPVLKPTNDYVAYLGRIIEPKGVHLAIGALQVYNRAHPNRPLTLKIAGKHYAGNTKDAYWQTRILPEIDDQIQYIGHLKQDECRSFLANARCLLVPSTFSEPFGMVMIEALACGTPVIGLDSGAIPEIICDQNIGMVITKQFNASGVLDEAHAIHALARSLEQTDTFNRDSCRKVFEQRFTAERMAQEHLAAYEKLIESLDRS